MKDVVEIHFAKKIADSLILPQTLTESVRYAIIQAEERAKGAEEKCTTARTAIG